MPLPGLTSALELGAAGRRNTAPTGGAGAFEDIVGQVVTAGDHLSPTTDADGILAVAQAHGLGTALGAGDIDGLAGHRRKTADHWRAAKADVWVR